MKEKYKKVDHLAQIVKKRKVAGKTIHARLRDWQAGGSLLLLNCFSEVDV